MSSSIQGKMPYVFAEAESPRGLAIAISNIPDYDAPTHSPTKRVPFPLRLPRVHSPHIHPTRVTVLHPFQRKHSRASSPYPFERGIVKIPGPLKKRDFTSAFQSYTYAPYVPTSEGLVRGVLFGLIPFEEKRVNTAATPTLLQLPTVPLPPLTEEEVEKLVDFHDKALERGIPFHHKLAIKDLIIELLDRPDIEEDLKTPLFLTLSRYAEVESLLKYAPTINMDLRITELSMLTALDTVAKGKNLGKLHPVQLYYWVVGAIHALKIPEKDHLSMYLCCKRYVYNKTYRPEVTSQIRAPVEPVSIEESIMQDLIREKDHPLLATSSTEEIQRWIDEKMTFYSLPPEKRESISKRVHDHILEYRASCIGYIKWTSGAGGV